MGGIEVAGVAPERRVATVSGDLAVLIAAAAATAGACVVLTIPQAAGQIGANWSGFLVLLGLTLALQAASVRIGKRGSEGTAAFATLAAALVVGPGPAIAIALGAAVIQWLRPGGIAHRAVFDAANFALSAAAGGFCWVALRGDELLSLRSFAVALLAGVAYKAVNSGLLCAAIALYERRSPGRIWVERFAPYRYHYLAFGPIALLGAAAAEHTGIGVFVAVAAAAALLQRITARQS